MDLYTLLQRRAGIAAPVRQVQLGLNWTAVEVQGIGLGFSPVDAPRTLPWSGTLRGRSAADLVGWLSSWEPAEAAVALATANAVINHDNSLLAAAILLKGDLLQNCAPGHLRVFEHFTSQVQQQRVVVIGRYPGLDALWSGVDFRCIERRPQGQDLPDTAAEYVLPEADWVFITASSIANKTLPRLLQLSRHAQVVLMGPSLPWLEEWRGFGVNYLAGINVCDADALWPVVAEGGGTRLFAGPVQYHLLQF